jgi:SAM-dependent methyltransferase
MTGDRNKADWSNYWQGRTAGEVGDALVGGGGVGIEHSTELADVWHDALEGFKPDISVLDLACGAGSVLRHAHKLGFSELSGIDISQDAIAAMQATINGATGIVGPVDKMPMADGQYDLVVSQFGFEYAGSETAVLNTAKEAVRILTPNGKFIAICHIQDGGIDREVSGHLEAIKELEATGFVQASKDLFAVLFAAEAEPSEENQARLNQASQALQGPRTYLNDWLNTESSGDGQIKQLGHHLFTGAADLFARRQAYALEDITGWLDGMQHEIDAYKGRMASMKQAALDEQTCEAILDIFGKAGYEPSPPKPLHFGNETEPAAWILKAG